MSDNEKGYKSLSLSVAPEVDEDEMETDKEKEWELLSLSVEPEVDKSEMEIREEVTLECNS